MAARRKYKAAGKYTPARFSDVLGHIREGETVTSACEKAGIARQIFYTWMESDKVKDISEERRQIMVDEFARAKEKGADARFENIVNLANEMVEVVQNLDPYDRRASAIVNAYNNKIHAEKWVLKILHPARYNDALKLEGELAHTLSLTDLARRARS